MLSPVKLDDEAGIVADEVDLHLAHSIDWKRKRCIQTKSLCSIAKGLQSSEQERLARAPRAARIVDILRRWARGIHEENGERDIDAVAHEAFHRGRVISFPDGVGWQQNVHRPPWGWRSPATRSGTRRLRNRNNADRTFERALVR
jgi:hypothetical protein